MFVYQLKKGDNMVMRMSQYQVSNSMCGDGCGWESVTLYRWGKGLAKVVLSGKRTVDVFVCSHG